MKQTTMPFYETADDATNSAILRSGIPFKKIACQVRPEVGPDIAYSWLKNALRSDAREKLSADQHILIGNLTGEYDYLYYCAQKSHHDRPRLLEPEDEVVELGRQIVDGQKHLASLFERFEGLKNAPQRPRPKAVAGD